MEHRNPMRAAGTAMAALGLLAAASCVSVLPEARVPEALVSLPFDAAQAPSAPLRADVAVYPPDAGRAWSGVDIAVRDRQELLYLADVRWVDAPPRLLQGAVLDALARVGAGGRAIPAEHAARIDYELRWRITELAVGRETAPARAGVEVTLVEARTGRISQQALFSREATPRSRAPRDRAAALAAAAQQTADDVAAFVVANAEPQLSRGARPQPEPLPEETP